MRKVKEIINGDFRSEGMNDDAQYWLKKIRIIEKVTPEDENVHIDVLDKLLVNLLKKHDITMQWINLTYIDNEIPWYSMSFKDKNTHEWIGTIYGMTVYEIYCKAVLFCYAKVKSSNSKKVK